MFGDDTVQLALYGLIGFSVVGVIYAFVMPLISTSQSSKRIGAIAKGRKGSANSQQKSSILEENKESRRKQLQEVLKQVGEEEKQRRKKKNLRTLISQAGLDIAPKSFWMISVGVGTGCALLTLIFGLPYYTWIAAFIVGMMGLPRWFISFLRNRRQQVFLNDFADAIDVMVRGLKAGLPVNDAMRVIASESGPPVGPEFTEVVEGQRLGIPIDQGIERMVDRMPLSEVQFLAIVMSIQSKTGGNLSEALNNLSKVLRDRKKMKAKIRSVSQEAKSSAAIIGSLPFVIVGALSVLNPEYMQPLIATQMGNLMLIGSGIWMLIGVIIMKSMINIDI